MNVIPSDSFETASQLLEVVTKENFDLVIAGHDSADYNGSAVGEMLAELLGWTSFSSVSSLAVKGDTVSLQRESDLGTETIVAKSPSVISIQKGIARDPRIPSLRGIMTARTKPLNTIEPVASQVYTRFVSFANPAPRLKCKMVDPLNTVELVSLLRNEANVL